MDSIRRLDGSMESHRRPAGRRLLLPAEIELCEHVGITVDDYFHFLDQADAYNGKRNEGYELIPDVRADPVTVAVNLVIGIALSAVSVLLAPKPKSPDKQKDPLVQEGADRAGRQRFAPTTEFTGLQQLAKLGDTIPLIFCDRSNPDSIGGVRVNSQLMWSQMQSLGTSQRLRALLLFGMGKVQYRPQFEGWMIGNNPMDAYTASKLALYFETDGSRIKQRDDVRYPQSTLEYRETVDVFNIWWDIYDKDDKPRPDEAGAYVPYFSGSNVPSTQTEFGHYDLIPNGPTWKLTPELTLRVDGSGYNAKSTVDAKRAKLKERWASYVGTRPINVKNLVSDPYVDYTVLEEGDTLRVQIDSANVNPDLHLPIGSADVVSIIEGKKEDADALLQVGESFCFGTAEAVCYKRFKDAYDQRLRNRTNAYFRVTKPGRFVFKKGSADDSFPHGVPIVAKVAEAVVTNTRPVNATEIGIKSVVWNRVSGFPNMNSWPDASTIRTFETEGGQLSVGNMDLYTKRYSFFKLEAREAGKKDWEDLNGTESLFAVAGNSPTAQFNSITIYPPGADTRPSRREYRFVPYSGNFARVKANGRTVYVLTAKDRNVDPSDLYPDRVSYERLGYTVSFDCDVETFNSDNYSSSAFYQGKPPAGGGGQVVELSKYEKGKFIAKNEEYKRQTKYESEQMFGDVTYGVWQVRNNGKGGGSWSDELRWYWDDELIAVTSLDAKEATPGDNDDKDSNISYEKGSSQDEGSYWGRFWKITRVEFRGKATGITSKTTESLIGGSGSGLTVKLTQYDNGSSSWKIKNAGAGYGTNEEVTIPKVNIVVRVTTDSYRITSGSVRPWDMIADYKFYVQESSSTDNGPEHKVVYFNEYLNDGPSLNPTYNHLAYGGIAINSAREWAQLSEISAYFKEGIEVEKLATVGRFAGRKASDTDKASSNLLPEIVYALLTDTTFGAGETVGSMAVSRESMQIAANFCEANGLYWDGVISERINLREWIFENAAYCLLDFTIIGGRFALVPSVPYNDDFTIARSGDKARVPIKALFTDGNIRNLEVSWLSPEERQLFTAAVKYRLERTANSTAEEVTRTVRFTDDEGGSPLDPIERFDMSGFCTSKRHAMVFAKYALRLRQQVDHGVKFETTPQAAMNLAPGEYFRLSSRCTHTDRFANGSIDHDGKITSVQLVANNTRVYFWNVGTIAIDEGTIQIDSEGKSTNIRDCVFTLANDSTTTRTYKVESLSYAEDGLVEVSGSYAPVDPDTDELLTVNWRNTQFLTEEAD